MTRIKRRLVSVIGLGLKPVLAFYCTRRSSLEKRADAACRDASGQLLNVRPIGCSCATVAQHKAQCVRP